MGYSRNASKEPKDVCESFETTQDALDALWLALDACTVKDSLRGSNGLGFHGLFLSCQYSYRRLPVNPPYTQARMAHLLVVAGTALVIYVQQLLQSEQLWDAPFGKVPCRHTTPTCLCTPCISCHRPRAFFTPAVSQRVAVPDHFVVGHAAAYAGAQVRVLLEGGQTVLEGWTRVTDQLTRLQWPHAHPHRWVGAPLRDEGVTRMLKRLEEVGDASCSRGVALFSTGRHGKEVKEPCHTRTLVWLARGTNSCARMRCVPLTMVETKQVFFAHLLEHSPSRTTPVRVHASLSDCCMRFVLRVGVRASTSASPPFSSAAFSLDPHAACGSRAPPTPP